MCMTIYDLICGKCRKLHDEMFNKPEEELKDEDKLIQEFLRKLCPNCKRMLKEEGFLP